MSPTVTVKLELALWVGVPDITPLEEKERPSGSGPAMDQVYGGVPPSACNVCE